MIIIKLISALAVIALILGAVFIQWKKNGQQRESSYDFKSACRGAIVFFSLLVLSGFFDVFVEAFKKFLN